MHCTLNKLGVYCCRFPPPIIFHLLIVTVCEVCVSSVEAYSMFNHLKLYFGYLCFAIFVKKNNHPTQFTKHVKYPLRPYTVYGYYNNTFILLLNENQQNKKSVVVLTNLLAK